MNQNNDSHADNQELHDELRNNAHIFNIPESNPNNLQNVNQIPPLNNTQNETIIHFLKKSLHYFEINEKNEAFISLNFNIIKIYGIIIFINVTLLFALNYLIILVCLMLNDGTLVFREMSSYRKEEYLLINAHKRYNLIN